MILWSCMLLVPLFWIIKFSGVLHEHKGELMILNSNAETDLWRSKGGALCGKSGWGCSFNAGGWSILIFWLIGRGVWCGIEGRRSCCRLLSSKHPLLFSPALFTALKVSYDATLVSTTVTNFPLLEGAMEAFHFWKIQWCSGLRPLLYPYRCKRKMIISARYK